MSVWNEDNARWVMPKLTLARERLPESGGLSPGTRGPRGGSGSRRYDSEDDADDARCIRGMGRAMCANFSASLLLLSFFFFFT